MNITANESNTKTVLELDLVAYSDIARALEENLDVEAVKTFQDQIQSFVDIGLKELRLLRDNVVLATAGDNAILIFDNAALMHHFAKAVQEATEKHNRQRSVESAKRWFRMGAATGPVLIIPEERRIVGTTVGRAVRLEAASEKGVILIDNDTFIALPEDLRKCYGAEEIVNGKRDEQFNVRRCAFVIPPESPANLSSKGIDKLQRPNLSVGVTILLAVVVGAGFFWKHYMVAKTPLQRMEQCRKDAESTLDSLSWQDELPVVLKRWREEALLLDDESLRKSILEKLSLMEEKSKILAKPVVKMSLDRIAEELSDAVRSQSQILSTHPKRPL